MKLIYVQDAGAKQSKLNIHSKACILKSNSYNQFITGEGAGADMGTLETGTSLVGAPAGLGAPLDDVHQRGLEAAARQRYTTTTWHTVV